jgi:hypothetical protein
MRGTSLAGERLRRLLIIALGAADTLSLLSALAACHKEEKAASEAVRPVRTVTVELQEGEGEGIADRGDPAALSGRHRLSGQRQILERPVDVSRSSASSL